MNESGLNLLRLHDIDTQILEVERLLNSYPKKIKAVEMDSRSAHDSLQRANDNLMKARASRNLLETEVKQKQETIKKFLNQQMQVKSNKEYQAITHQVQTIQEEISEKETEVLEALENEEALEAQVNEAKEAVRHADREAESEKERIGKLADEKKELLKRLKTERKRYAQETPEEIMEDYEGLFDHFPGNALVPAVNGACGGCHINLLAATLQLLQESNSLVPCPHCSRLLYPPDAANEAHIA